MEARIHADVSLIDGRWRAGWTIRLGNARKTKNLLRGSKFVEAPINEVQFAELAAIKAAIDAFVELSAIYPRARLAKKVRIMTDNKYVADLMNSIREKQNRKYDIPKSSVLDLIYKRFDRYWFQWVPRNQNKRADSISRQSV